MGFGFRKPYAWAWRLRELIWISVQPEFHGRDYFLNRAVSAASGYACREAVSFNYGPPTTTQIARPVQLFVACRCQ